MKSGKMKRFLILFTGILFFLHGIEEAQAQKVNAFATVNVWPKSVYPKQPIKVTISVFSSTWFAEPLEFQNLVIQNCFIVPYTRTVPSIQYIKKKKYAALTFYYLVFPYAEGELLIPSLTINASIPPEGDYKGVPIALKTKAIRFNVKSIPDNINPDQWFVANGVWISEKWSKPLDNLKVGDVVERTIVVKATGTLPGFIPDLQIEEQDFLSLYLKDPEFDEKRKEKTVVGTRSQTFIYLFEKEGAYKIPAVEVSWWNSLAGKMYSKQLSEKELSINANPDLGILTSIKDSLNVDIGEENIEASHKSLFTKKRIIIAIFLLGGLALFIWFIILIVKRIIGWFAIRKNCEKRIFERLIKEIKTGKSTQQHRLFYEWLDVFNSTSLSELPIEIEDKWQKEIQPFLNNKGNKSKLAKVLEEMRVKLNKQKKGHAKSVNIYRLNP